MKHIINYEDIAAALSYDPLTGVIKWKYRRGLRAWRDVKWAGKPAGTINHPANFVVITFNRKQYKAHRLAWMLVTGKWPEQKIQHINGDHADNRWSNLREVTHSQIIRESHARQIKPGIRKGKGFRKVGKKFAARITVNKKYGIA